MNNKHGLKSGTAKLDVPTLEPDSMKSAGPYRATQELQAELGYPVCDDSNVEGIYNKVNGGGLPALKPGWKLAALTKLDDLRKESRGLQVYLDSCVKCGACTDKCHYFLGTGDPKNMPVARQDLLRKVYQRHFTLPGKLFPKMVGAVELTEEVVEDWYNYFHQCSQCRRCSVYCPFGIDTSEITMAAREVLNHIGYGQKYSNQIISKVHKIGNNLGLPEPALADTLEGLEEDIFEETGVAVKLPLDQQGADVLLVTPSADFFAEPHVDGLIGYAKVFHELGLNWTISSYASEAANFGLFTGSRSNMQQISQRIVEAAKQLGVRRIVFGECGHAWRVAYSFLHDLAGEGELDFLDQNYPVPQHVLEVTWSALQAGELTIDKSLNDDKVVTFHDSCNVARASNMGDMPGGQFKVPRDVIKAVCNHFVEMHPDTTHDQTFCCGAGGGLLTDDLIELRLKGAQPRMQAFNDVVERGQVTHMAAICAICKSQFSQILPKYGFSMDGVISVHQLVGDALVLTGQQAED